MNVSNSISTQHVYRKGKSLSCQGSAALPMENLLLVKHIHQSYKDPTRGSLEQLKDRKIIIEKCVRECKQSIAGLLPQEPNSFIDNILEQDSNALKKINNDIAYIENARQNKHQKVRRPRKAKKPRNANTIVTIPILPKSFVHQCCLPKPSFPELPTPIPSVLKTPILSALNRTSSDIAPIVSSLPATRNLFQRNQTNPSLPSIITQLTKSDLITTNLTLPPMKDFSSKGIVREDSRKRKREEVEKPRIEKTMADNEEKQKVD